MTLDNVRPNEVIYCQTNNFIDTLNTGMLKTGQTVSKICAGTSKVLFFASDIYSTCTKVTFVVAVGCLLISPVVPAAGAYSLPLIKLAFHSAISSFVTGIAGLAFTGLAVLNESNR